MPVHEFGGDWTEQKLERLRKYLSAFMKAMDKRTYSQTIDVDAFAGTGCRTVYL